MPKLLMRRQRAAAGYACRCCRAGAVVAAGACGSMPQGGAKAAVVDLSS